MIYVYEVTLNNGKTDLPPIIECVNAINVNEGKENLDRKYSGDWKVGKATLIGSRKKL